MKKHTQNTLFNINNNNSSIATQVGIWIKIQGIRYEGAEWNRLKRVATVTIYVVDREKTLSYQKENPDAKYKSFKEKIPVGVYNEIQTGADTWELWLPLTCKSDIEKILNVSVDTSNDKVQCDILTGIKRIQACKGKDGAPITMNTPQLKIIREIFKNNTNENITSAMGGGKSLLLLWVIAAFPELRPAVVLGKGVKDTNQLEIWLNKLLEANPELDPIKHKVIKSGGGKTIGKRNGKLIEEGNGIIIMTHRSAHKIPENTQLLCIDESHESMSLNTVKQLVTRSLNTKRIYTFTATNGNRADKGDRILTKFVGHPRITANHEEFESINRVTPVRLHIWNFTGETPFRHNKLNAAIMPSYGYDTRDKYVVNHKGRSRYCSAIMQSLPIDKCKLGFTPTIKHAKQVMKQYNKLLANKLEKKEINIEEYIKRTLYIFHSDGIIVQDKELGKEKKEYYLKKLLAGEIKSAIATDFLAVGVDTNYIDHILDFSGQLAKNMVIQRFGRAVRVYPGKVAHIHIVADQHTEDCYFKTRAKIIATSKYFGLNSPKSYALDANESPLNAKGVSIYKNNKEQHLGKIKESDMIKPINTLLGEKCGWFDSNIFECQPEEKCQKENI